MPDTPYVRELESATVAYMRALADVRASAILGRSLAETALTWGSHTLDRVREYIQRDR